MKPRVIVFYTDGINRDQETIFAFKQARADVDVVHLNQLIEDPKKLEKYQIAVFPGGFANGDDIVSGKIMAVTILNKLREDLEKFIKRDTLTIGICNGFQVLTRMGLLPFGKMGSMDSVLVNNDIGHLESRWVKLRVEKSDCVFTRGMEGRIIEVPASNGEGKFMAEDFVLDEIENANQCVLKYVDEKGNPTMNYPANPSASLRSIAGVCDPSGKIFGLMPHPECYVKKIQHPNWQTLDSEKEPDCLDIFNNAVNYFS